MIRHMVAIDSKRGIAKDGLQPWKIPLDERYFREQTMLYGGVILMGRKTFEAMGSALPDHRNFVLTHDTKFEAEGVTVIHSLDAFLAQHHDVWIIGGSELYAQTLDRADELYITEIEHDFNCDTFYPDYTEFEAVSSGNLLEENHTQFSFKMYKHRTT